ncbi:MAG TPA: hypothetical protein VME70_02195, partial [Mycobacteriales bacterium]|nr:hypothetical protein [Mycobacteriales bacterium]
MHTEEPFDDDDGSYPAYPGLAGRLWQLVWSPAALGIASLALGLAALTISQASEEIGEVSFFGSGANSSSELSQIRVAAG